MPNVRLQTSGVNVRMGVSPLNVRAQSFQTGQLSSGTSTTIPAGTPIGLLLALTYAQDVTTTTTPTYRGDLRPNVRITT